MLFDLIVIVRKVIPALQPTNQPTNQPTYRSINQLDNEMEDFVVVSYDWIDLSYNEYETPLRGATSEERKQPATQPTLQPKESTDFTLNELDNNRPQWGTADWN